MLFGAVVLGALLLIFLAYKSTPGMTIGKSVLMALLGTLWIWIAGVIVAECIGRTNWSPLSGMTLIAVTILVVIANAGLDKPATILASMLVGAAKDPAALRRGSRSAKMSSIPSRSIFSTVTISGSILVDYSLV